MYVILGLLILLLGYVGIGVYKKTNKFERKVLVYAGIFQMLIFPFLISPGISGIELYLGLPLILMELSLNEIFSALGILILLYIVMVATNAIVLSVLMGSSRLEHGTRRWFSKSWVGRLVREMDYFLYRDSDVMSLNYKPLKGWRKLLSPFPITIFILCLNVILRGILPWDSHLAIDMFDALSYFYLALMLFGAFVHFYSPPLSRKFKYDLILAGVSMISLNAVIAHSRFLTFILGYNEISYAHAMILVIGMGFVKKSKFIFNSFLPKDRDQVMKWVKRNTLWFIPIVILVIGDLLQLILLVYLLMRFHMVNWLFDRPILYFRSFVSDKNKNNFTDIIGLVGAQYGVVTGLVHTKPHSEEFRKVMRISERARLFMVPDNKWKEWVLSYMKKASAIIIDFEVKTEGVKWEVDKSKEICGEEHVIILDKGFWDEEHTANNLKNQKERLEALLEKALKYD